MNRDWKQRPSAERVAASQRSLVASLVVALGICASVAWPARVVASQALAQKYGCVGCHQAATKIVGPSWKDIEARYGEGKITAAQLAASIKDGSLGKWGTIPMPPQTSIPDADLQSLARWVLDDAK